MIVYIKSNAEVLISVHSIQSNLVDSEASLTSRSLKNRRESAKLKIISSIHKPRDTALPESWIKTQKARQIRFHTWFEVTGDDCIISVRERERERACGATGLCLISQRSHCAFIQKRVRLRLFLLFSLHV